MIPTGPHYMFSGFRLLTRNDHLRPATRFRVYLYRRIIWLRQMTTQGVYHILRYRSWSILSNKDTLLNVPQNILTTLPSNVESIYSPETLGLAILVLDKPFWSRPSICDTSSSAESSIYSDRSNKPFLKYIRQDIFQKEFDSRSTEPSTNFL